MEDKELNVIVEIERLLGGMKWEAKHRVLEFVKARANYDPIVDGGAVELCPRLEDKS